MKRLLPIVLSMLAGCGSLETVSMAAGNDMAYIAAPAVPDKSTARITVLWRSREEIAATCGPTDRACSFPSAGIIYTERPQSWNDQVRLLRLGHEVMHLLGAVHP